MTSACALVGATGFVGQTLARQTRFDRSYRSTDIANIRYGVFDIVVCAAAPAQKWIANRNPVADRETIESLIRQLETVSCARFVLISTVDVFKNPVAVDEGTNIDETGLQPYGLNRRLLEVFVAKHFRNHLIVRLPGLVGPGLRKNVIFDLLNGNNLDLIDSRGVFQFYPMVNLWKDIELAMRANLCLLHLTAQAVGVADVAWQCFGKTLSQELPPPSPVYDMRTRYASLFGGIGNYQYSQRETMLAIRAYAQSEIRAVATTTGGVRAAGNL